MKTYKLMPTLLKTNTQIYAKARSCM